MSSDHMTCFNHGCYRVTICMYFPVSVQVQNNDKEKNGLISRSVTLLFYTWCIIVSRDDGFLQL